MFSHLIFKVISDPIGSLLRTRDHNRHHIGFFRRPLAMLIVGVEHALLLRRCRPVIFRPLLTKCFRFSLQSDYVVEAVVVGVVRLL